MFWWLGDDVLLGVNVFVGGVGVGLRGELGEGSW